MESRSRRSPSGPVSQYQEVSLLAGPKINAHSIDFLTATVLGVRIGDVVTVCSVEAPDAGLVLGQPRVSANGQIEVPVVNPTAGLLIFGGVNLLVEVLRAPIDGSLVY